MSSNNIHLIDTPNKLESVCQTLSLCGENDFVSVDTEFTRVKSFFPGLNLIQLCIRQDTYLIDTMVKLDIEPFFKAFTALKATVLFYSAREDLEILAYKSRVMGLKRLLPQKCVDIQLLLAFLNLSYSQGLQSALSDYLKIELPKDQTRSDWEMRPLTDAQIDYAANDVLYLEQLYREIMKNCKKDDPRYAWFETAMLDFAEESCAMPKAEDTYKAVSGAGCLNIKALNVLRELCSYRYNYAVEHDEALNRVITGKALCPLARMNSVSEKSLIKANMKFGAIRAHGKMIVEWHEKARKVKTDESIAFAYDYFACNRDFEKPYKRLRHILRTVAKEQGIAEQIICNKQNCNDYFYKMYYKQTPDLMKGWYKECVGHIDYDSLFAE